LLTRQIDNRFVESTQRIPPGLAENAVADIAEPASSAVAWARRDGQTVHLPHHRVAGMRAPDQILFAVAVEVGCECRQQHTAEQCDRDAEANPEFRHAPAV
jgi:hypothetical protein